MTEKYEEIEQTCENCKHRNGVNGFDEEPCCYCDEHYNKFELSDGLCQTRVFEGLEEFEIDCELCKHYNPEGPAGKEPCDSCYDSFSEFDPVDGLCVTCKSSEVDYDKWPCDKCFETEDMGMWENNE